MNMYFTIREIFSYSEKYNCYNGVSMILMLFYTLAYFNKSQSNRVMLPE